LIRARALGHDEDHTERRVDQVLLASGRNFRAPARAADIDGA